MRHNDTPPYQACNHKDTKDTKNLIDLLRMPNLFFLVFFVTLWFIFLRFFAAIF